MFQTSWFVVQMEMAPAFRFSIAVGLSHTRPEEITGVAYCSTV